MSVIGCIATSDAGSYLKPSSFRISETSRMPVVSPRRFSSSTSTVSSSSAGLTGSYRSTLNSSSSLDRPFYSSATNSYITPRSSLYSSSLEKRLSENKRSFARHSSITEDGGLPSSRLIRSDRSESRETSVRRDNSLSRTNDSIVSVPYSSRGDRSRDISVTGRRISSVSITTSVDDIRKKYSPTNYVPNVRKTDSKFDISRSKSISNDIGRPPIESKSQVEARPSINRKNKDISTSPRLNRSSLSQSPSRGSSSSHNDLSNNLNNLGSLQNSSNSLDRERSREDKSYEKHIGINSIKNLGLNGLRNIGNTCFMNSVIQCLSNTRFLLEYLRQDSYLNDINTTTSSMKGALVKAFSTVIQELWSSDSDKIVNTTALKSQIQRFAPRFMGYAQQDAQEFLRYLLEGLHEDVNRVTVRPTPINTEIDDNLSDAQKAAEAWSRYLRIDDSAIVDVFVGQLKSTLKCTVCGHCSVTFDPFWDLSLPLASASLTHCLEHFTREETLDGHEKPTCAKCQQRRKCTKSFSIQKFPKILVLHLKRFSPMERFRGKLSTLVDFPLHGLDLSAFAANRGTSNCVYNLYAISNHSGTTYSGHYTAYCKHPYSNDWHEYNDSRVSSIMAKNVVSSEAYVLFYELANQSSHL